MKETKIIVTSQEELESMIEGTVRRVMSESSKSLPNEISNSSLLLSVKEAAAFLKLAPQTIYGLTSKRLIPFIKRGKTLYFKQAELWAWLEKGKKKSSSELEEEIKQTGRLKL